MNTKHFVFTLTALAVIIPSLPAEDQKTAGEKTRDAIEKAGEKTAETLEKAGDKTKEVLKKAGEKTKEAGRSAVDASKEAANAVVDAVTADKDARPVEVNLREHQIDMPKNLESGKTAFVVHNNSKEKHNFSIKGEGIDKKFLTNLSPDETKVLHVDLKPGTYNVSCPVGDHEVEGMNLKVTAK